MTSTNLKSNTTYIGELETTIGSLAVFRYRVKGMIEMERYVGDRSASEINPSDYIRKLVSTTSYLLEDVIDGVEPEERASNLAVQELSLDDLDGFSSLFLEHHNYLEKERRYVTNNENGKKKLSFEWGERVEHRLEGEREYEYLHRLLVLEQKSFKEQGEKNLASIGISAELVKQFKQTSYLTSAISDQIKAISAPLTTAQYSLKSYLNNTSEHTRKMAKPLVGISLKDKPSHTSALKTATLPKEILHPQDKLASTESVIKQLREKSEQETQRQNRTLELSEQALQKSEQQLEVMRLMAETMVKLDQNQLVAAEDSAQSSISSERIARRGLAISWAVLILTVCGLGITVFSTYMSYSDSKVDSDALQENIDLRAEIESKSEEINALKVQSQKVTELEEKLLELQLQLDQKDEPSINLIKKNNNQSVENR